MSTRVTSAGLDEAAKQLNLAWQRTKMDWADMKSLQFEEKYLEKLPTLTGHARNVIDELDATLRKIRKDCE